MKIKLSKSQWQNIGKKAGWMKKADFDDFDTNDIVGELVEKAQRDPKAFEEALRAADPDISRILSDTMKDQQRGYEGLEKGNDIEDMVGQLNPIPRLMKKRR